MRYPRHTPVKIILLGAGGTGGHLAPHIYRLCFALERNVRFILVDGDTIEPKNLVRQHFSKPELGMNKARAIAERYASGFGLQPEYIPRFIESAEELAWVVAQGSHTLFIAHAVRWGSAPCGCHSPD